MKPNVAESYHSTKKNQMDNLAKFIFCAFPQNTNGFSF